MESKEKVVPYKKYLEVYKGITFKHAYFKFLVCDLFYKYGLRYYLKTPVLCKDPEGNEFVLLLSAETHTHKRHKPNRGPGKKHYFYYRFVPLLDWIRYSGEKVL